MNLEDLRAVQTEERASGDLKPLSDGFYREVAGYLDERRRARERAAGDAADPFGSDEVRRLTDEIETAEEVVEAIYERRVGKVVRRASLAAAGMPTDDEGLTAEEAELFADLVELIRENRQEVLAAVAGEGGSFRGSADLARTDTGDAGDEAERGLSAGDATDPLTSGNRVDEGASAEPTGDQPSAEAADAEGTGDADTEEEPDGGTTADGVPGMERVTLRITRDVGEIFGVDERTYTLSSEDVVTLPAENAKPLLERNAAQLLD